MTSARSLSVCRETAARARPLRRRAKSWRSRHRPRTPGAHREGKGQAVAAPMIVCLRWHEGIRSNEALGNHANLCQGGRCEYRKSVAHRM